ncbi:DNA-processing protein DprA [Paenibacillus sp. FSL H7-689]|uniref:DNA-processing protein DprA n=1 Tax=Paenibacillus sp. FSL H7-689 TaxID=1227349 RepID=UPI0003E22F47|nr:DNA-processing protein DprA [Paenibacillus sp. FSL H7-689]ETT41936.1 hypothetical protein C170_29153 [Paenibacillus sp. FSL H7-689]
MERISDESLAILLLTSDLLYRKTKDKDQKPFTHGEWNKFATLLRKSEYSTPAALYDKNENHLMQDLLLSRTMANKVCNLMKYAGSMAIEIEKLAGMGIWIATRGDKNFPQRVKKLLKEQSPPFFYGTGNGGLLHSSAIGFVGSRDADESSVEFTKRIVRRVVEDRALIVSGGAKGIDLTSQNEALEYGGQVVSFVHSELGMLLRKRDFRNAISDGNLVVLSAVHPSARFTGFNAMGRNKYIYTQSKGTVVVSSNTKGGTWEGANENLKNSWVPLIVRASQDAPEGNIKLLQMREKNSMIIQYTNDSTQSIVELLKNIKSDSKVKKNNTDLFYLVWPVIKDYIKQDYKFSEMCEILNILPEQLDNWIKRGTEIESNTIRNSFVEQTTLF